MTDERIDLRNLELREVFAWTHLFRGFQIALDWKKVVLGAAGAISMAAGWWVITMLLVTAPDSDSRQPAAADATDRSSPAEAVETDAFSARMHREAARFPWQSRSAASDTRWPDVYRSPLRPGGYVEIGRLPVPKAALLVLEPPRQLVFPVDITLNSPGRWPAKCLILLWTLAVWALFGGAITRIAAVQIARDGQVGLAEAIRFVGRRYIHYFGAPLLPLIGIVLLGALCAIAGALCYVWVLDILVSALWILTLLAGFAMAVALLGVVVGWPLMYSAISVEATEAIDAVGRSYSYVVFGRPWYYVWYALVAIFYGGVLTTFVVGMGEKIVDLSKAATVWGGAFGAPRTIDALFAYVPEAGGWRDAFHTGGELPEQTGILAAVLVSGWIHLVFLAIVGFAYSYFWSASTIIYLLLRRAVDETEMEEVYLEAEEDEPFPTIAPAVGPLGPPTIAEPGGASLPIVEPPKPGS